MDTCSIESFVENLGTGRVGIETEENVTRESCFLTGGISVSIVTDIER